MINLYHRLDAKFPTLTQLFRFGVVGLLAAATHFSLVVAFVQFFGMLPLIANVFAFSISFQVGYFGHRRFTFHRATTSHRTAFTKLLMVQIANFSANETLFYIFLSLHLPYPIALLIVLSVLPIFTFVSSKFWVFR